MDFFLMAWEKDPWHFGFFDWMIATGGCMLSISRSGTRYPLCGAVSQSLFGDSKNETLWVYSCVCVANDYSWVTVQSVWSSWCGMCGERKRGSLFTVLTFTARMSSCFSSCCHLADAVSCQQWTERWAELVSNPRY